MEIVHKVLSLKKCEYDFLSEIFLKLVLIKKGIFQRLARVPDKLKIVTI